MCLHLDIEIVILKNETSEVKYLISTNVSRKKRFFIKCYINVSSSHVKLEFGRGYPLGFNITKNYGIIGRWQ